MKTVTIAIPQMGNSLFRKYMKSKYTKSLERAGAASKWIELEDIDQAIEQALACDGLLLPGGADIDPALYGQVPCPQCGKPNVLRDKAEPQILAALLETGKPILGICRGIQMLNVSLGGTLCQDIKPVQKYPHSDFLHRAHTTHPVQLTPGSHLSEIFGESDIPVNSIHHQCVDLPGKGLTICATSPEGFTEGLELSDHPFCIGVQWHPEHMSAHDKKQQALFDAFVAAAGQS